MNANQALYPIREVSRITGVNSITLRAWERRYGLIEPIRTDSGHRLYTEDHVEQIRSAVNLTQQGIPISRVKSLLSESSAVRAHLPKNVDSAQNAALMTAIQQNDLQAVENALDQCFVEFPELQAYQLLIDTLFALSTDSSAHCPQLILQTALQNRLQTRLGHGLRKLSVLSMRRVLLYLPDNALDDLFISLLQLAYLKNGYYSFVQKAPLNSEALTQQIKQLHIDTLATAVADSDGDPVKSNQGLAWFADISALNTLEIDLWQKVCEDDANTAVNVSYCCLAKMFENGLR